MTGTPGEPPARWSVGRIVGSTVIVAVVLVVVEVVVAVVVTARRYAKREIPPEEWSRALETDGLVLAAGTIGATLVGLPLLRLLAGAREARPWRFLGFRPVSFRRVSLWLLAVAAAVALSDSITALSGRPVVHPWMVEVYESGASPLLLLLAVVVLAPLLEETFFRGFLMGALESRGSPIAVRLLLPSALWALLHLQYEAYGIVTIFLFGILLGFARVRTGSIVPCLVMHAFSSVVATVELVFAVRAAGG